MFKAISSKELYDSSNLSFVFEFFTPINKREAAAKFARALGKKVKWFTEVNESFVADRETFKLTPVYSNSYKKSKLSTGFMPYQEAVHMFLKVANVIESIGYTCDRCRVQTRIRLNESSLEMSTKVHELNRFKYLLNLNEEKIFELWPSVENENHKIYRNQLNFIQPREIYNTILTENRLERMDPVEFNFPESEFFGTSFTELNRGQLLINYIGGKDYTKKKREAVAAINLVIEHLHATLSNNYSYNIDEKKKISDIVNEFRKAVDGTKNYFNFKQTFPNVSLYVDLKPNNYLIEANYTQLREKIFKAIVGGGIVEAAINYDSKRKVIQIKDAVIKKSILVEGIEFYQCTVEADAKGCLFEGCIIKNSKLSECTIFSNNFVKNSKLIDCDYLGGANEVSFSYLDNSGNKLINASLRECLVYRGKFTLGSTIDRETKVISKINE